MLTTDSFLEQSDIINSFVLKLWHIVIIVFAVCFVIVVFVIIVVIIYYKQRNQPTTIKHSMGSTLSKNRRRTRNNELRLSLKKSNEIRSQKPKHKKKLCILHVSEFKNTQTPSEKTVASPLMIFEPLKLSKDEVTYSASTLHKFTPEVISNMSTVTVEGERDNTDKSEVNRIEDPPYFQATKIPSQRQLSENNEI